MKDLNNILSEFLAEEKLELRKINSISSKISKKPLAQCQEELEQINLRLHNRVPALQETCKDCYQCIGELVDKNLTLFQELETHKNLCDAVNRVNNREMAYGNFYDCDESNHTSSESDTMSKENEDHAEFLSNIRKGFLHKNAPEDGRKKLHEEIDVQLNY